MVVTIKPNVCVESATCRLKIHAPSNMKVTAAAIQADREKLAELHEAYKTCRIRTRNDVAQMQRFRPDWTQLKPRF